MGKLQKSELKTKPLLPAISKLAVGTQHDLEVTRQVFLTEEFRDSGDAGALVGRDLQQAGIGAGDLRHRGIAQKSYYLPSKMKRAMPLRDQSIQLA
jgi:hypothetical protein